MRRIVFALVAALLMNACALAESGGVAAGPISALEGLPFPMDAAANTCYIPVDDIASFPALEADGWQILTPRRCKQPRGIRYAGG